MKEIELATIQLTPEAERRLGIETAKAERRRVAQTRTLGGDVMVPPGGAATITAPRAGTVLAPHDGAIPAAGTPVSRGTALLRLVVLPAERDALHAREELAVAEARYENALAKAERARQLAEGELESIENYENAQAELRSAEAVLRAARAQVSLLEGGAPDSTELSALTVAAPVDGVIRTVAVAPGQVVSAGAAMITVERTHPLWVRVPVYVGDLQGIATSRGASIQDPGAQPGTPGRSARAVTGPPSADPAAVTADLYFEVANHDRRLRPGQRVGVTVMRHAEMEGLVVPWSAVLHDLHGGTWVYERTGDLTYARRRIEVAHVVDESAVLSRGPAPGAIIVSVGAAELFSIEFGISK